MTTDYEALFQRIEAAVDAHPLLQLDPQAGGPDFRVSRYGFTAKVRVKLIKSRKKPVEINGSGDTAEEATSKLIDGLDIWAQVLA